jgi:hypothetical protein
LQLLLLVLAASIPVALDGSPQPLLNVQGHSPSVC